MKAGKPEVQGQLWLHTELRTSLGYSRPCQKQNRTKPKQNGTGEMTLKEDQGLVPKHSHGSSRSSVPGDPGFASGLHGHQAHALYTFMPIDKTTTHAK